MTQGSFDGALYSENKGILSVGITKLKYSGSIFRPTIISDKCSHPRAADGTSGMRLLMVSKTPSSPQLPFTQQTSSITVNVFVHAGSSCISFLSNIKLVYDKFILYHISNKYHQIADNNRISIPVLIKWTQFYFVSPNPVKFGLFVNANYSILHVDIVVPFNKK